MPHNILMSKIRCYNPNKSHAALKNLNYIVYIGTRPGVDLTDVKLDELTAITEEDITPDEPSANSQYIYYIAKRQNSQGLFGNFEFNNITEVAHEVRDVTDAGVNVYRGIVSLSEEDAVALGYNQKDTWVKYMHSVMNDVGNSFGIPLTALKWCAAVHMEQGHPHCHYTFWRTDGKVMSSYIHVSKQNEIREFLSGQMFKAEREMFLPEKNQYRDATIGAARSFMNSLDIDFNHIPERITQQQLQHMSSDLIELVNSLPGRGSLKYKLLPPKCKILVDKVVEDVIQIPAVNKEYTAYMKAVSDISTTYSGSTNHQATNQTVADEDIRKRLANSILKSAITLSLIQKKNLSGELSSPLHNDNLQVNSVHLYDEDSSQVNSVHLYDEDSSQVNSVHLYDEVTSQVNSVHLINGKIYDNVKQPKLEWTAAFKGTRNSLYSLDKEDPNYTTQFNTILDALISYHNQGYLPATYLLARLYNSKSYPIYDKEISDKLYTLSYNNFKNIFEHPELYISNHKEHKKGDNEKSVLTPEQQESFLSYHLGKMSERGLGCEINYNDAISYYKNCLNDNAYAQYALANIYLSEKTTPLTPELYAKSLKLLESASNKNPYAAYEYAQHLERPIFPYRSTQNEINSYYRTALDGFLSEKDNDTNLNGSILYKIGKLYYEGKGCEKDVELAYKYFMKSAECKNKNAYYALGKTCSDKTSPHYDPVRAEQYYIKAYNEYTDPETGESHAPSYLKIAMADLYANQENDKIYDINKAIDIYKECIETNADSMAMFKLGSLYLNGKGVDENVELGLKYINAAIAAGNKFVKITMAGIYSDSNNKLYNMDKAIELYKDCAENDSDSFSMFRLGSIYFNGNGVEKNTVLGLQYLDHAAKSGNKYAKITMAGIYSNGDNEFYDMNKAIRLYKDCAENENEPDTFSMYRLGAIYLKGKGVEKNIELGLHYLNNAIDEGNSFAKVTLADFYADSTHSRYNITKAIQLYKDCIKNDSDSYSMSRLGSIYLFGHGVDKDEALGLKYLNDAVANGNEHAKKTIEFYNNMKHSMAISASFSLAYHFLSALSDRRNQIHLLLIHSKPTSKEARIDAYKKSKEHSSPDFEH